MTNANGEFTPLVSDGSISTFRGAKIASSRWITVEPILVAASMGYGIMLVSQSQFIHEYFQKKYMVNNSLANYSQCNASMLAETDVGTKIQEATTMWAVASTICTSIGGIPVGFALGSYSDQIGRKIPMMIATSGMVLCAMFNFVTIQFKLALYFLLIGTCVLGLTGNFTLVVTMCMSYAADVTSEGKRMMRIVVLDVILLLSMGLPMLGIGFLIRQMGYAFPFLIVTAANLLVLLYLLVPGCLLETVQRSRTDGTSSPIKIIFKDTVRILKVKENYRHIRIILYILVDFTVVGIGTGTFFVTILYGMGEPLCLSPEKIGFLVFCIFMFTGVGAMVGGAVLPFCLSTFGIMYVSLLSHQALFIATALATDELYLFLATSLGVFKLLAHPIVKTELSKMVASDEQGTLFAIIGITGSISELLFPVSFQTIYASSLSFSSRFVFYLSAGLLFIPWGIMIVLHCFNKKGSPVVTEEDSHMVEAIGDIR